MMARSAIREPAAGVKPVGFLDNDLAKRGSTVAGLPVFGGLDHLDEAIRRSGARMLLITLPNPSGQMIRRVMDRASRPASRSGPSRRSTTCSTAAGTPTASATSRSRTS